MNLLSLSLVGLATAHALYICITAFITARRRAQLARSKGCQPAVRSRELEKVPFGLRYMFDAYKALQMKRLPQYHDTIFNEAGHTWEAITGFMKRSIFTSDPKVMQAFMTSQFADFGIQPLREERGYDFLGDGIFLVDGKPWETARVLLKPQFAREQVADIHTQEKHTARLLDVLLPENMASNTVEVSELFAKYTMDTGTEFLFGRSSNILLQGGSADQSSYGMTFSEAFAIGQGGVETMGYVGKRMARFFMDFNKFTKAIKSCHELVDAYVNRALEKHQQGTTDNKRYIFLDELAKITQDRKVLRYQALNILFAARDSTASLLSWTIRALARHPAIQEKLRAQIADKYGEGKQSQHPSYAQLRGFNYLQWVIKEVLRLYPIVPLNAKVALRDTTLPSGGGPDGNSPIFVKEGQRVMYSVYSMQRRKDLYGEDANDFRPERWEEIAAGIGFGYLPFNAGPRVCIGQQRAMNEIAYLLVRILQQCERIEMSNPENDVPADDEVNFKCDLRLVMSCTGGVPVRVHRVRD